MPRTNPAYPPEFRREAIRLIRASDEEHPIPGIAREIGVSDGTLRSWVNQDEIDEGEREGLTTEEKEELRRLRREVKTLLGGASVGAFLKWWLDDMVKPGKTHRTYSTHKQQILSHVAPTIGQMKLGVLRKAHVDRLYADLLRGGEGKRPLAPSSVRRVHAVLHDGLEEAVRGDLIPRNPAAHVNKPKVRQKEIEPLDAGQAWTLLDAAGGDRFEALYAPCLTAGLRQGEALGLKWPDVDLAAGTLRVERQLQRVRGEDGSPGRLEFSEPNPIPAIEAQSRDRIEEQGKYESYGDEDSFGVAA